MSAMCWTCCLSEAYAPSLAFSSSPMRSSTFSKVEATGLTICSTAVLRLSRSPTAFCCWVLSEVLARRRNCSWFALSASDERALKVSPSLTWASWRMRSFSLAAFCSAASLALRPASFCFSVASESRRIWRSCWVDARRCLVSSERVFSASSSVEILATIAFLELEQMIKVSRMPMMRAAAATM